MLLYLIISDRKKSKGFPRMSVMIAMFFIAHSVMKFVFWDLFPLTNE